MTPIKIQTVDDALPTRPLNHHEVYMWSLQTYIMLASGVPLVTALDSLAGGNLPRLAPTCEMLSKKLSSGFRLSEAMKSMGHVFGDFIISIVVVGENTGRLAEVLQRGSVRAARRDKTEREIRGALAYPFFLAVVSIGMALFMGFYMFPQLLPFLNGLGVPLPWPTRVLIWSTENLSSFILIGTILFIFLAHLLIIGTDPRILRFRTWLLYNAPIIGDLNGNRTYSDCMNDLSLLLEAGCDLVSSLKALQTGSSEYRKRIDRCIQELKTGNDFTESVEISGLFPRRFLLQIKSGEETGNLAKTFKHLAAVLDESISMKVGQLVQLLEPAILTVMGLVTGFIVIATFMPLYSMASSAL
ncbi:MAG: type II secretion system F family protein [Vulcanimicrobiota bacterium]